MTPKFSHTNINIDLETAKDGRWVLLINPILEYGHLFSVVPDVIIGRWVGEADEFDGEIFEFWETCDSNGAALESAEGYVELSNLGLFQVAV